MADDEAASVPCAFACRILEEAEDFGAIIIEKCIDNGWMPVLAAQVIGIGIGIDAADLALMNPLFIMCSFDIDQRNTVVA